MAIISKNFLNDTQAKTLSITPIVVVADLVDDRYELLDCFSTADVLIEDDTNQDINSKPIISKISSTNNSLDHDKKSIKINTFRFSIYNYYDVTKKLTDSDMYSLKDGNNPQNSFIGKYVILYYKTPKTDKIDLKKGILSIDDNACSIIFTGIINRISQTDKEITIQAEDFTQQYIQDKSLPTKKVVDLDDDIKNNIIDRDDEQVIPIIFGKVDRCPSITYKTNIKSGTGFKSIAMIHESKPISNKYGTSKTHLEVPPFHVYLAEDSDYLHFPYNTGFYNNKDFPETTFVEQEQYIENEELIFPELEDENVSTPIICIGYTFPTSAYVDLSGDNDLSSLSGEVSESNIANNQEALWYNFGIEKKWYREPYDLFPQYLTLPPIDYQQDKKTRWILMNLDKSKKIFRMLGHLEHFTELDEFGEPKLESETLNTESIKTRFKPFNPDFWKAMFEVNAFGYNGTYIETWADSDLAYNIQFEDVGYANSGLSPNDPHHIFNTRTIKEYNNLPNNPDLIEFDHSIMKESFDETVEVNRMLWYESPYTPQGSTRIIGHRFSSLCFQYFSEISGYESETFYASLEGRKDYSSTEDIDNLTEFQETYNITPTEAALGPDGQLPDFEALVNEWDDYFSDKYTEYVQIGEDRFTDEMLYNSSFGSTPDWGVVGEYQFKSTTNSDDSTLLNTNQITSLVLHGLMKKLYLNIYDKVMWFELYSSVEYLVYSQYSFPFPSWLMAISFGKHNYVIFNRIVFEESKYYEEGSGNELFDQLMVNVRAYSPYRKLLLRRIFKYLYQNPLNEDDATDSLVTGFTYEYDSFGVEDYDTIESISDFINNLTPYLDDTISTINKSILDEESQMSSTGDSDFTGSRHELYVWDENPNIYGNSLPHLVELWRHINQDSIRSENFVNLDTPYQTSGVVEKPTDIFINILSRELGYGTGDNILDPNFFNVDLIEKSRDEYEYWKMGFCINEEVDAKKLLEDISKETKSFFTFTPEGNFGLVTIKSKYTYDDINHFIDEEDIIDYKITRTKRENIITSCKYFYNYDNGQDKYTFDTGFIDIGNYHLLDEYDGFNYYNLTEEQTYKEKELRYHTDRYTAKEFLKFDLLNNVNQHLIIDFTLPLSMAKIKLGDIIQLPLINNTRAFGIDYSKVERLNGQYLYPMWVVTGMNITLDSVKIKAIQLHHLPRYSNEYEHGYSDPDDIPVYVANLEETNTRYPSVKNWNYLPPEQREEGAEYIQGGLEIPYGDVNKDGILNVVDIVSIVGQILGEADNEDEVQIADINGDSIVNVVDIVEVVSIILGD